MKPIEAIYRHGRLYDLATNQSITHREEAKVVIVVNPRDVVQLPQAAMMNQPRSHQEVSQDVVNAGYSESRQVLERGQKLYFTLNLVAQSSTGPLRFSCQFELTLLEELYVTRRNAQQNEGRWHNNCLCEVNDCLTPDVIANFIPIVADSLNQAYRQTYETHFTGFGSPSANIYDKLFTDRQQTQSVRALRYFPVV